MPRITTYAIDLEIVKKVSSPIAHELAKLLSIPKEYVSFQVNQDSFVSEGKVVKGDAFIEISLFDRGEEKEDLIAKIVTTHFQNELSNGIDVYLTKLERRRYFENGTHF